MTCKDCISSSLKTFEDSVREQALKEREEE